MHLVMGRAAPGGERGRIQERQQVPDGAWRIEGAGQGLTQRKRGSQREVATRREQPKALGGPQGQAPKSPSPSISQQQTTAATSCHCHLSASAEFSPAPAVSIARNFPSAPETLAKPSASLRRWQERPCIERGCQSPILKLLGAPVNLVLARCSVVTFPSKLIRN